jgi:hypothetical protein
MSEDGTNKTDTDQYVQLPAADDDDLNETPARPVTAPTGNNAAAPAADELPKNSAATGPYLPFDPLSLQILRPLN